MSATTPPSPESLPARPGLAGRAALVVGAGRGIGRGIALSLAASGAHVTAVARTAGDLEQLRADAASLPGTVAVAAADTRDEAALTELVDASGPELLVCAAGINRPGPLLDTPLQDVRDMFEVNVIGTVAACRAFGRGAVAAQRGGAVVILSSQMGVVGYPGRAPYCATKHAVNGLTKALAVEWSAHRIRVNAVAPTFIRTPLTAPMLADPAFEEEVLARIPMGRIGEVQDVTGAVAFLLSSDADLITGHILAVDGGWTVW